MLKEPIITPARMLGSGLAAGSLLGIYLKFIEHFTSFNVYTLLLNVDYIPGLNRLELPEWVEFLLHLAISVLLSAVLAQILRMKLLPPARAFTFVAAACTGVGVLLYPTTALSDRTPGFTDPVSFLLWLSGHLLYGAALGRLLAGARARTRLE
ncbi:MULTISPECIES: hypothetical protein [Paenibacillus]|uniref:hypothetical protein n=1 Tax=Paenibacillus TaxID=44249 RepID=UPI0011A839BE|nr:hypothetical protein [Paenibacillus sp. IHBB 10380]